MTVPDLDHDASRADELPAGEEHALKANRQLIVEEARAVERELLRECLRTVIIPGLHALAQPGIEDYELIALADAQARRVRSDLDDRDSRGQARDLDADVRQACEDERQWVRGHLHDTVLQILEFIASDGFGTKLSAAALGQLAGKAAEDLGRWLEDDPTTGVELLPELESIAQEAWTIVPAVRLVVEDVGPMISEQAAALAGAVREAVTNARKHASASRVVIRVQVTGGGRTMVTVADDGVGIEPRGSPTGYGIRTSIVGRMRRAGGDAWLENAPGGGTLVRMFSSRQGSGT